MPVETTWTEQNLLSSDLLCKFACRCGEGYYNSYKDDEKLLCSECHKSCQSHCNGSGPKACAKCAQGYQRDTEHGCTDIDECIVSRDLEH